MILGDGSEIQIGSYWEINVPCIINIERSKKNLKRWKNFSFMGINLTKEQAKELCEEIQKALKEYDHLEKSLEEYHAKSNTDE